MKIYKQNGDILELTVSEYKELFEIQPVIKINTPRYTPPKDSTTVSWTRNNQIKYPDIPGEGYMSTSTK